MNEDGDAFFNHLSPKKTLDMIRYICKDTIEPDKLLCQDFNRETQDGRKMGKYWVLLERAITSIVDVTDESNVIASSMGWNLCAAVQDIRYGRFRTHLPPCCEVRKRERKCFICQRVRNTEKDPETKFYQNLNPPNKVRQQFIDEIKAIIWQNKIAPDTITIAAGEDVTEIEVIEIQLHQKGISRNILGMIGRGIPYHIVFVLTVEGKGRLVSAIKRKSKRRMINIESSDITFPNGLQPMSWSSISGDSTWTGFMRTSCGSSCPGRCPSTGT